MQDSILYINEEKVRSLLDWDETCEAVETAMRMHHLERTVQPPRTVLPTPTGVTLYVMPGYLQDNKPGAFACKLATAADNSKAEKPLPNIMANIALFNDLTGELLAIVAGTEITKWRTAAASVVATKHLASGKYNVLAVLGSGVQGEIHSIAFHHYFKFKTIRIWNHNRLQAQQLVKKLSENVAGGCFVVSNTVQECLRGADVIVTATSSTEPLVEAAWIKNGAHINAVGVAKGEVHELDVEVYNGAHLYIDTQDAALTEMKTLLSDGVRWKGEIGGIIDGSLKKPKRARVTIFQSLGMAVEDCAMARLIYDRYMKCQQDATVKQE